MLQQIQFKNKTEVEKKYSAINVVYFHLNNNTRLEFKE